MEKLTKGKFNELVAGIMDVVQERLTEGQHKFGDEYFLSDVAFEFDSEVHDLIGWIMLHAVRLKQVSEGVVQELNDKYLDIFARKSQTAYLKKLCNVVNAELKRRETE